MFIRIFYTLLYLFIFFFFNDTATTEIYTLSLHDALPIAGVTTMRHCFFLFLAISISLPLAACSGGPPTSPAEKYLSDARNSLKTSDFTAAVKDLDEAIKSAGDDPLGQQAAILRVALVTA